MEQTCKRKRQDPAPLREDIQKAQEVQIKDLDDWIEEGLDPDKLYIESTFTLLEKGVQPSEKETSRPIPKVSSCFHFICLVSDPPPKFSQLL